MFLSLALNTKAATNTWTGATSTAWATASNWSLGTVPTGSDDVIIVSKPNQPIISTSVVAKSIEVWSTASLNITATGVLTITGTNTSSYSTLTNPCAFYNGGTINNNGQISIGATGSAGNRGILNSAEASFINDSGGEINIDRFTITGLSNTGAQDLSGKLIFGLFDNKGKINIGKITSPGVAIQGIGNSGKFINNTDAEISIDNCKDKGLFNLYDATFENKSKITIGTLGSVGLYAIDNYSVFSNTGCGALINIISNNVINNRNDISGKGIFNNSGTVIERASGISSINTNTGIVQNLNGGTLNIATGQALSLSVSNALSCTSNGSVLFRGLHANTAYTVAYSSATVNTTASLSSNSTGEATLPNVAVGQYSLVLTGACLPISIGLSATVTGTINSLSTNVNPSTCTSTDGSISFAGLLASTSYGVVYNKDGGALVSTTLASNNTGTLTIPGLRSGTFTNIVLSANSCTSAPSSARLNPVNSTGGLSAIAGGADAAVCQGNPLIINTLVSGNLETPTVTISNPLAGTFTSTGISPSFTVKSVASTMDRYSLTVSSGACVFTNTFTVNIDSQAPISAKTEPTVAQGGTITLGAGVAPSYSWKGPAGFSSTLQNPSIPNAQAINAGGYTLSTGGNCGGTIAVNVGVSPSTTTTTSTTIVPPVVTPPTPSNPNSNLLLKIDANNLNPTVGSTVRIAILVANLTANPSGEALLMVNLPLGTTYMSGDGFTASGQTISRTISNISASTYTLYYVNVSINTPGALEFQSSIFGGSGVSLVLNVAGTPPVSLPIVTSPNSGLILKIDATNRNPNIGSQIRIAILVSNTSDSPSSETRLSVTLPAGMTFVNSDGFTASGQTISRNVASLNPRNVIIYFAVVRINTSGILEIRSSFFGGISTSLILNALSTPAPPVVIPPTINSQLAIAIDANNRTPKVGNSLRFAIFIKNNLSTASSATDMTVTLPTGLTFVSGDGFVANGQVLSRTVNTIAADGFVLYFFNANVTATGTLSTQATITNGASASVNLNASPSSARLGTEENTIQMSMNVAPNPSQGMVQVTVNLSEASTLSLRLTDLMGREMSVQHFEAVENNHTAKINLAQYQAGMYLLTAEANGKMISKKVLKVD